MDPTQTQEFCDTIICPRWLIPVVPEGAVLEHHAIAVRGGKIAAIGTVDKINERFFSRELVELPQHVLIPGLVNAHTHAAMTLMRGLADDLPLMRWLGEHIWPAEGRVMSAEFVRDGATHAIAEQLLGGVTTMNDMYFFPDQTAEAAISAGMRACVSGIVIEFPSAWAANPDEYLAKAEALCERYRKHDLIRVCLAAHAPYTVSDRSFGRVAELCQRFDSKLHCHVHETAQEIQDSVQQFGMRPLERMRKLGVVNSRLMAVHMTQLVPEEIELIANSGAQVLHCPESNLKLASGFCPVASLQKAGITVALGTDGCASNNDLDLLGELKTAALLAKAVANDAEALPAAKALTMATLGGARALGMDKLIGSIEVGKQADLTALSMADLDLLPIYSPLSHLVYANHRRQVTDVWVAGKAKVRGGQLTSMDTEEITRKAHYWAQRIVSGKGIGE